MSTNQRQNTMEDDNKSSASRIFGNLKEKLGGLGGIGDSLHHDIRRATYQYNPLQLEATKNIQMIIKTEKNTKTSFDNISKERFEAAKRVFMWGHEEDHDLQDVTDRLSLLIHRMGEIEATFATQFEQYRTALKDIRNFEANLNPTREKHKKTVREIAETKKGHPQSTKLPELEANLEILEQQSLQGETQLANLKRNTLKAAFTTQFDALIEESEKLAIIGGYGKQLLAQLDTTQYSVGQQRKPYEGANVTKQIMADAKQELASWKPSTSKPRPLSGAIDNDAYSGSVHGQNALQEVKGEGFAANVTPTAHAPAAGPATSSTTAAAAAGPTRVPVPAPPSMPPRPTGSTTTAPSAQPLPLAATSVAPTDPTAGTYSDVKTAAPTATSTATTSSVQPLGLAPQEVAPTAAGSTLGRSDTTTSAYYRNEPAPAYSEIGNASESIDAQAASAAAAAGAGHEATPSVSATGHVLPDYAGGSQGYPPEKNT